MENPDETTANIGAELSKIMSSNQIKYMFGDRHSIYHFASDFSIEEIDDFLCLVSNEFENFNYFLTQKTKNVKGFRRDKYKMNKLTSIEICKNYIKDDAYLCDLFDNNMKKDDLSDACLQAVAYIRQTASDIDKNNYNKLTYLEIL
jgi:hypothetical protein